MHARLIAVGRVVVTASGGKVNAPCNLFVEQSIEHRIVDKRIDADGELPDVSRACVRIEYRLQGFRIRGRRLYDLSIFKDKANVFVFDAPLHGRRVVGNDAVDALFYGRGINFAVGNV